MSNFKGQSICYLWRTQRLNFKIVISPIESSVGEIPSNTYTSVNCIGAHLSATLKNNFLRHKFFKKKRKVKCLTHKKLAFLT